MSIVSSSPEQRVVLDSISWSTYLAILGDAGTRRGRIAYDQGVLEIMSPSKVHEKIKRLLGRMVEVFTEQRRIPTDPPIPGEPADVSLSYHDQRLTASVPHQLASVRKFMTCLVRFVVARSPREDSYIPAINIHSGPEA